MKYSVIIKLFLLVNLNTFLVNSQTISPKEILNQCALTLKSQRSFVYDAAYKFKFFDQDSIISYQKYKCEVIKAPLDTILGYHARVSNDNEERIYNGEDFNIIWHKVKEIHNDIPSVNGKKFTVNNIKKEYIPIFLYSEKPFNNLINKGFNWKISDTIIDNYATWKIELLLPPNEEITYLKKVVYVEKGSKLPLKTKSYAKYRDIQNEYFEITLENYKLNTLQPNDLKSDKLPQDYKVINYKPIETPKIHIKNNFQVGEIKATDITGKEIILNLSSTENNLVLLDFWHFACAPCLKLIPRLNDLYNKNKNSGLTIYGLNPYDNSSNKIEIIKKFSNSENIQYPLLFIEKMFIDEHSIDTFPTTILLKNGQLLYSFVGYSEEHFETLEKLIQESVKTN
ncbi:redoxin domain-containing protein [Flavobacterium sp. TBRC 19031]|uniref:redoxin domain-containing protein n=1 Tax=Flavobacterium mekongense TaxID=3379707 RepID=UPI00399A205C